MGASTLSGGGGVAVECRAPGQLPHFQTKPLLLAVLSKMPILWEKGSVLSS
jgi:hypothetical protein